VLQNFLYTQARAAADGERRRRALGASRGEGAADRTPLAQIKLLPDDPAGMLPQIAEIKKRYTGIFRQLTVIPAVSSSFPRRRESRFGFDPTAPFSIATVAVLAILVLLPVFWLLVTSLRDDAKRFTLDHYHHLVADPAFLMPLWTTLWTSAAVGLLCLATAAPMAWLVARTDLPGKRFLRTLILASFVTPPFLGAFAWVLLGGPNAGPHQPVVLRALRR
jgi:hypothetical protein